MEGEEIFLRGVKTDVVPSPDRKCLVVVYERSRDTGLLRISGPQLTDSGFWSRLGVIDPLGSVR